MKQHDGSELKGPLELAPEAGAPWQKLEAGVTVSPKMLDMVIGWCFDGGLMVMYIYLNIYIIVINCVYCVYL